MLQIARRIHIIYQGIGKWDKELIMKQAMAGEKRDHAKVLEDIMPFVLAFSSGAEATMLDDLIEFEQTLEFERLRARTRYHCMQRDISNSRFKHDLGIAQTSQSDQTHARLSEHAELKRVDRIKRTELAFASMRNKEPLGFE